MENIEVWKDVVGFESLYEVSNIGNVNRITKKIKIKNHLVTFNGKSMIPLDNGMGYLRYKLSKNDNSKRYMAHRIVAEAFIKNPEGKKCVNHKDGNKKNNDVSNLEWNTHSENTIHALKNGLIVRHKGENHAMAKLSNHQVKVIRRFKKIYPKVTCAYISKIFKVSGTVIERIIKNKTYKI
jgi:hypothetical protein